MLVKRRNRRGIVNVWLQGGRIYTKLSDGTLEEAPTLKLSSELSVVGEDDVPDVEKQD